MNLSFRIENFWLLWEMFPDPFTLGNHKDERPLMESTMLQLSL